MKYHEKYDPDNGGTQFVFNKFYKTLAEEYGIKSNMIACAGTDGKRYMRYANMLCSTTIARAYLIENDYKRYGELFDLLKLPLGGKVRLIHGNVFNYLNNPAYREKRPCRIEDFGIGIYFQKLVYSAIPMLDRQRELCHYYKWKVQILDGAIRQLPKHRIWDTLQAYLNTIDVKIKTINGSTNPRALEARDINQIYKYIDKTGKTGTVYEHKVKLWPNTHQANLYLYCCLNGSPMMQTMLVYK